MLGTRFKSLKSEISSVKNKIIKQLLKTPLESSFFFGTSSFYLIVDRQEMGLGESEKVYSKVKQAVTPTCDSHVED